MGDLKGKSLAKIYPRFMQTNAEIKDTNLKAVETGRGNSTAMRLSTTRAEFLKVGIGTAGNLPDGLLHVMSVSAGSVSSSPFASLLTLENSGDAGLSILSGKKARGNIYFGDEGDNDVGQISYDHANNVMDITVGGRKAMSIDSGSNVTINGSLSYSDERYKLDEFFTTLPALEKISVTQNAKYGHIVTDTIDLAATDTVEFQYNNASIKTNSTVAVRLIKTSVAVADNAIISINVNQISSGLCKIRIGTNATDIASMTFTLFVEIDPHIIPNQNFVLTGNASVTDQSVIWATSHAGINIATAAVDNSPVTVWPRSSSDVGFGGGTAAPTAWRGIGFGTENKTEFKCAISTDASIADLGIVAGMKLTSTLAFGTDANQCAFIYGSDDTLGTLTTNANLHFIYSIAGVDYITDLGLPLAVNTTYKLIIKIDSNRKISIYVNGKQLGLATTSVAGGVVQAVSTQKSLSLTDDIDFLPVIGCQTFAASGKSMQIHYIKMERDLFE